MCFVVQFVLAIFTMRTDSDRRAVRASPSRARGKPCCSLVRLEESMCWCYDGARAGAFKNNKAVIVGRADDIVDTDTKETLSERSDERRWSTRS